MSDQLFATEEATPKSKRVPPANPIIGQARAAAWDAKFDALLEEHSVTQTVAVEAADAVVRAEKVVKKYIIAATAVLVVVQIAVAVIF